MFAIVTLTSDKHHTVADDMLTGLNAQFLLQDVNQLAILTAAAYTGEDKHTVQSFACIFALVLFYFIVLTLRHVIAISLLLFVISLAVNGYNFLCTFVNILRQEQADGCKLISHGILITFQGSSPTGTSALISYIELNNMSFLNYHLPGVTLTEKHRGN